MIRRPASFAVLLLSSVSCGAPTVGEAVRPKDMTAADVRGEPASCHDVLAEGTPLVVDWTPEARGDLEASMKQGITVVHFDCNSLKVLPDCRLEGRYGFIGITRKEQIIKLDNADQAQANLPLSGAKLGASLSRGSSIDIGLVMIGKKVTSVEGTDRSLLTGKCDGATHVVQSATVGAFAMKTAATGEATVVADLFGAGASAASSSSKSVTNRDGDLESCKQADVDGPKPPNGCGAPLRLRLVALEAKPIPAEKEPPRDVACGRGLVAVNGKCATAQPNVAHDCGLEEGPPECAKQCAAGSAASCGTASLFYMLGLDVAQDDAKSLEFSLKGCDLGDMRACWGAGASLRGKDNTKRSQLLTKACLAGVLEACGDLGLFWRGGNFESDKPDLPKALRYSMRACHGGRKFSCGTAAQILLKGGPGLPADGARAAAILEPLCSGRPIDRNACYELGGVYERGDGVPADAAKAKAAYKRSCGNGDWKVACERLKKLGD